MRFGKRRGGKWWTFVFPGAVGLVLAVLALFVPIGAEWTFVCGLFAAQLLFEAALYWVAAP